MPGTEHDRMQSALRANVHCSAHMSDSDRLIAQQCLLTAWTISTVVATVTASLTVPQVVPILVVTPHCYSQLKLTHYNYCSSRHYYCTAIGSEARMRATKCTLNMLQTLATELKFVCSDSELLGSQALNVTANEFNRAVSGI
jgi:hypothetical protein